MQRRLTILFLLLLAVCMSAQTTHRLRVYHRDGVVDTLRLSSGSSLSHSRLDLNGVRQDDYVTMLVSTPEGDRRYLISTLDSLVLPNGRRVVFRGSMTAQPTYAKVLESPFGLPDSLSGSTGPRKTSFRGTFPGAGTDNVTFYWTENDRIRLDTGDASRAERLSGNKTSAEFVFDGADLDASSYMVYYPDKKVTIPIVQRQTGADNSDHIGESGDCGVATATYDEASDSYSFTLRHKASYLCFLPHIDYLPSARITKIVLTCSSTIAGDYQLSSAGLYNGTNTSNTITLELSPQKPKDFFIGHDLRTEQDSCAAYMVIAPQDGSRSFTAAYYVADTLSHIEKVYRQTFSFQPLANTVHPISCNIRDTEFRTIDLGLSCNWSSVNVNATEPSRKGDYFADDAAANAELLSQTVVTEWLMPTDDQRTELLEKCEWEWGEYNGVKGYLVTGAAASKEYGQKLRIFLPATGSTQVSPEACLSAVSRPVEALMVDLGLPSGVKWAARNVGANSAEDYGSYYAWGEVAPKENYSNSTYKYGTQNLGDNYDISGTQNDAAAVNWGGVWRMPTSTEMAELMNSDNCQWTWTSINGVNGYMVSSKAEGNINRIFLPAAGLMTNQSQNEASRVGSYATATQGGDNSGFLWAVTFNSSNRNLRNDGNDIVWGWSHYSNNRVYGHSIRAVAAPTGVTKDGLVLNITTDSTSWKLGDTTARLYGTLSSTMPLTDELTVGFIVGDSAEIVKGKERFDLHQTVSLAGTYSQPIDVYDNIGYWYRAYVETADTIFYGKARHYGYEMVDLGLSVKWANMNLGADAPEDYGNYYAWGETETKEIYTDANYKYGTRNLGDDLDIAGTENDAAHVNMGNAWRMPTKAELEELMNSDNCTWTWTSQNSVNGYRVTSKKNGNSIFMPAAGLNVNTSLVGAASVGSYPTSTQGGNNSGYQWTMTFQSSNRNLRADGYDIVWGWANYSNYRSRGHVVRAVAAPNAVDKDGMSYNIRTDSTSWRLGDTTARLYGTLSSTSPLKKNVTVGFVVGDSAQITKGKERILLQKEVAASGSFNMEIAVHDNMGYWYRAFIETEDTIFYGKAQHYGYEMVDLGLSVKWANMNLGASKPADYGDFYAWGETEPKESYTYDNYQHGSRSLGDALDIADTELDAAHVNMGNAWRMPTRAEMQELIDNCTWTWTSQDNVNGFVITSKKPGYTDRSIFLPAAGLMTNSSVQKPNEVGSYATSTQPGYASNYFYALTIVNSSKNIRADGYDIVWNWANYSNYRAWGHSIRAVASPNAVAEDKTEYHIRTGEAVWQLGDTEATISGTLSSTTALQEAVTTGLIMGDSPDVERATASDEYKLTTTSTGSFTTTVDIHDNMGCWYRAFLVTPAGEVFYGKSRHVGQEMVDLGLPSGTRWANMNVGSSIPEDNGSYFAWGETQTKATYTSGNYVGQPGTNEISGTAFDAAYTNMGNQWRLPTPEECNELGNTSYCTWTWTTQNSVTGYLVTSKTNGRSIFLPAAGFMSEASLSYEATYGSYWTGTCTDTNYAQVFNMTSGGHNVRGDGYSILFGWNSTGNDRWHGRSVRAVER